MSYRVARQVFIAPEKADVGGSRGRRTAVLRSETTPNLVGAVDGEEAEVRVSFPLPILVFVVMVTPVGDGSRRRGDGERWWLCPGHVGRTRVWSVRVVATA
ncbi:Uncharacterized protein M6B38_222865 [Iris pallida]|uniref:Uncharacterized protein n=1 Tax=Iris pallida TaxID=29817 RepID=A0AAX6DX19_IRIPA|nr:Uncharacterized protein M6B38_222865 [Iris pallida]